MVALLGFVALSAAAEAAELHVAVDGKDSSAGTAAAPLRTIQRGADLARPGDTVIVHQGVYRERIAPPRGGESDAKRIVYRAAPGEKVEIKGSEVVTGWVKVRGDAWKATLPNAFFGKFNPYSDLIRGDWFNPKGREHHTGAVYLNGHWLAEAAKRDEVLGPVGADPLWFAEVDKEKTTIWAQFQGVDPNRQLVEINVRRTVFYPEKPGINYLTVRGFTLRHAATPWAPPTAQQIGLIGTHWSKGWIIEDNVVSHSVCVGIALGKHGDPYDNTSANSAEGYVKTIERAHAFAIPWTKARIGHHVVRRNTISHCEQAGVVGSLGAAFSTIEGNVIHDIHLRHLFGGAEMAGIKIHGAIDTVIRRNHVYRTCLGLWLDWMAQGTRVSANLFHDNTGQDLFVEVNHGPFIVDNNLFLSSTSLLDMSEGGAYAHNLFAGRITNCPAPNRETPYHRAHSTRLAGLARITGGDDRFYNNMFIGDGKALTGAEKGDVEEVRWISGHGLWGYDGRPFPLEAAGNVYYHGAEPYAGEADPVVLLQHDPQLDLEVDEDGGAHLSLRLTGLPGGTGPAIVTTALLGKTRVAGLPYENRDRSPLEIDTDYLGHRRSRSRSVAGPFASLRGGSVRLRVW